MSIRSALVRAEHKLTHIVAALILVLIVLVVCIMTKPFSRDESTEGYETFEPVMQYDTMPYLTVAVIKNDQIVAVYEEDEGERNVFFGELPKNDSDTEYIDIPYNSWYGNANASYDFTESVLINGSITVDNKSYEIPSYINWNWNDPSRPASIDTAVAFFNQYVKDSQLLSAQGSIMDANQAFIENTIKNDPAFASAVPVYEPTGKSETLVDEAVAAKWRESASNDNTATVKMGDVTLYSTDLDYNFLCKQVEMRLAETQPITELFTQRFGDMLSFEGIDLIEGKSLDTPTISIATPEPCGFKTAKPISVDDNVQPGSNRLHWLTGR